PMQSWPMLRIQHSLPAPRLTRWHASWLDLDAALRWFVQDLRRILLQAARQVTEFARGGTRLMHQPLDFEQSLLTEVAQLDFTLAREAIHARGGFRQVIGS